MCPECWFIQTFDESRLWLAKRAFPRGGKRLTRLREKSVFPLFHIPYLKTLLSSPHQQHGECYHQIQGSFFDSLWKRKSLRWTKNPSGSFLDTFSRSWAPLCVPEFLRYAAFWPANRFSLRRKRLLV